MRCHLSYATHLIYFDKGIDATAGPLPPPPRTRFDMINLRTPPPPRPPRLHSPAPPKLKNDLEAMKQALQLPPSVAAKLAKTPVNSGAAAPVTTAGLTIGETKPLRVNSKRGSDKAVSDVKDQELYVIRGTVFQPPYSYNLAQASLEHALNTSKRRCLSLDPRYSRKEGIRPWHLSLFKRVIIQCRRTVTTADIR